MSTTSEGVNLLEVSIPYVGNITFRTHVAMVEGVGKE